MAIRKAMTFVPNPNYSGVPNPDPAILDELMAVDVFVTSRETVLRVELAIKAGQFNAPTEGKRELFSEDLW